MTTLVVNWQFIHRGAKNASDKSAREDQA